MKVIAVYGSGRKNGNGADIVNKVLETIKSDDLEVQKYYLTDMTIKPCIGCFACRKKEACVQEDEMSQLYKDIVSSDFVIFSSPIFMGYVNGPFKMMNDRLYPMLAGEPGHYTKRYHDKKCMLIVTQGAPSFMFRSVSRSINSFFKIAGFNSLGTIVCGSSNKRGAAIKNRHILNKVKKVCNRLK